MALLMYDDLRKMDSPTSALLDFLESAYQAGRRPPAGTSKVSGTSPPPISVTKAEPIASAGSQRVSAVHPG